MASPPTTVTLTKSGDGWQGTTSPVTPATSERLSDIAARNARLGPLGSTPAADVGTLVPNKDVQVPIVEGDAPLSPFTGVFVDQKGPSLATAPLPGAVNFQGLSAAGVAPPDSNGSVGPNHYVQWINSQIAVYDKTGAVLVPSTNGNLLFTPLGGVCANRNNGDPIVIYDALADRWNISQFVVQAPITVLNAAASHQCIAVSVTNDPTGAWYLYDFPTTISRFDDFVDYEKLSTWTDGYYMTANVFCTAGTGICPGSGVFGGMYSFERDKMLLGQPARLMSFANPASATPFAPGALPIDIDGLTPPPPGRPLHSFFFRFTNTLSAYTFSSTWGAVPVLTATALPNIAIGPAFAQVACTNNAEPAARRCVPQPAPAADPADQLDALRSRVMFRAPYRNRAGTESVMLNLTVAGTAPVKAAIRWFELQLQSGTPTIVQQGVFQPDTTNRFMGSIAMDASGNVALGYSRSARSGSPAGNAVNVIPELDITGRLAADPLGTLSGETLIQAGGGIQTGTNNRWGDYSYMAVDPRNGCTFWFQGEYLPNNGTFNWTTRIGTASFAPANCAPESQGTITGTVTYAENGAGALDSVVYAGAFSAPTTNASGAYTITAKPGAYAMSVANAVHGCTVVSPSSPNVNVVNGVPTVQNFTLDGNARFSPASVTIDDTPGNGNGRINRAECFRLVVPVQNSGCHSATDVTGVLTTMTPGVIIKNGTRSYGNLAIGATSAVTSYDITTTAGFV
ncbi:MAG: hypothetical protein JNK60_08895, partial [Acidobacteria bacterium]|nr:hypothetical protein [Acidobacteriota bacterium]